MTATTVRTDQRFKHHDERVVAAVRDALLRIAEHEEAAAVRWDPQKASVIAHRTAATALRLEAERAATGRLSEAGHKAMPAATGLGPTHSPAPIWLSGRRPGARPAGSRQRPSGSATRGGCRTEQPHRPRAARPRRR